MSSNTGSSLSHTLLQSPPPLSHTHTHLLPTRFAAPLFLLPPFEATHRISSTMLLSALSMCHTAQCWHWQNTAPRAHATGFTSRAERPPGQSSDIQQQATAGESSMEQGTGESNNVSGHRYQGTASVHTPGTKQPHCSCLPVRPPPQPSTPVAPSQLL
jgi:hypothetical protein